MMTPSLPFPLRPLLAVALATLLAAGCATPPPTAPAAPITVKLIAFNDFHGNLQSPGTFARNALVPPAQRPAVGGADALAAHVARLKAGNPLHAVVGGGDFVGASPLVSGMFFDEPTVEVLNRVGVDFTSVGNHEFDKGSAEILRLQRGGCRIVDGATAPGSCKGLGSRAPGSFDGASFKWLSANVVVQATGKTLLPAYGIKAFGDVKMAFIGMTLHDTPKIVTPAGVAGLEFRDEADTVNALVPELRAQGVQAIVVLVHQGGAQPMSGVSDINGCEANLHNPDGSPSDIEKIVNRLDDAVDLVISAHTHAAYNCSASTVDVRSVDGHAVETRRPTGLANKAGRLVPVTSASSYGRVLTDIDVTLDGRTHRVTAVAPTNRLVDRTDPATPPDAAVGAIVQAYAELARPLTSVVAGSIARALPSVQDEAGEQAAGDLVADAHLAATQPAALGGAQIAFTNAGGVRTSFQSPTGSYPYAVTYGDAFRVLPFRNTLVTMTLTGRQLKTLLEQQFAACRKESGDSVMQVSSSLKITWSAHGPACAKIVDVTFTPTDMGAVPPVATGAAEAVVRAGAVLQPDRRWRISVNSFMASGGDAFAVLLEGADVRGGDQDIDALVAYLGRYKSPAAAWDPRQPSLGLPRIVRVD
jgi:5'-nucleotidase